MAEARAPQPHSNAATTTEPYLSLDPEKIVATAVQLRDRIHERFPGSGLRRVAEALLSAGHQARRTAHELSRPVHWIRGLTALCLLLLVALFVGAALMFKAKVDLFSSVADFLQGLDAALNEMVFLGIAVVFLLTLETRFKRRRALRMLHMLRSLAHVIDMHQLTKDPERLMDREHDTPSSPERRMSPFELARYLDYCSEMLAVISKLAALQIQRFDDPVTLSAVNDIEDLTQGFSRKIWQKIMILDRMQGPAETP